MTESKRASVALMECAEEMRKSAVNNMAKFRKKTGKPDRFKGAREYWHGYAQAAANLRLIANGFVRLEENTAPPPRDEAAPKEPLE